MTIEERAQKNESLPAEVLEACKACDVLVKGPFVTPRSGDPWPNMVSANSLLRRALQLYAAVRPVRIPEKGIDWTSSGKISKGNTSGATRESRWMMTWRWTSRC